MERTITIAAVQMDANPAPTARRLAASGGALGVQIATFYAVYANLLARAYQRQLASSGHGISDT